MNKLKFIKTDFMGDDCYQVYNKKQVHLGKIYIWKHWNKWVWEQDDDVLMSKGCLKEVIDFMKGLSK